MRSCLRKLADKEREEGVMSMNCSGVGDSDGMLFLSLKGSFRKHGYIFKPDLE